MDLGALDVPPWTVCVLGLSSGRQALLEDVPLRPSVHSVNPRVPHTQWIHPPLRPSGFTLPSDPVNSPIPETWWTHPFPTPSGLTHPQTQFVDSRTPQTHPSTRPSGLTRCRRRRRRDLRAASGRDAPSPG